MRRARAFTLVVLAVVAIAAAVVIPTAVGGTTYQRVRTAARTLLAHAQNARSDAVALGRRVDLVLDLDAVDDQGVADHAVRAEHESDPFGAPGELTAAPAPYGTPTPLGDNVRIMGVEVSAEPGRPLDAESAALTDGVVTITFLPDGTAQAAEIWLGAGTDDAEQIVVTIDAITGRVRILTPEALQAEREESE